jgi:hypothetical protein
MFMYTWKCTVNNIYAPLAYDIIFAFDLYLINCLQFRVINRKCTNVCMPSYTTGSGKWIELCCCLRMLVQTHDLPHLRWECWFKPMIYRIWGENAGSNPWFTASEVRMLTITPLMRASHQWPRFIICIVNHKTPIS